MPTVQQRIVRAKRTIAKAGIRFEVPRGEELAERLSSVLEVVYLIFNEGYAATAGDDWIRPQLSEEALRLGRILAALAPDEPEVHGLLALMEIQASRFAARVGPSGEPVLLLDQNRARWDHAAIRRGLAALERAETKADALAQPLGPYALQAAIAACHARARTAEETDWRRIVALYEELAQIAPSPVVELHRAVALSFAYGPAAGLALVDVLKFEPALENYHLLPAIRGDLLVKLGRARRGARRVRARRGAHPQSTASASCCSTGPRPAPFDRRRPASAQSAFSFSRPISSRWCCSAILSSVSIGRLRNTEMRLLSMRNASAKARCISASLPSARFGSGTLHSAVIGWPGHTGQLSLAALSQTVKMKSI